jgi:hypothetical protein
MSIPIIKGRVIENSPAVLLRRVTGVAGTILTSEDIDAISVKVWNSDYSTLVTTLTPDKADVVYDDLQTTDTSRWTLDSVGYNWALTMPGTAWPAAGTYAVEVKVTPTAGDAFYLLWRVEATNIYSE